MARVICPACRTPGNVPDEYLGRRIKCPHCGERFAAPTLPAVMEEAARRAAPTVDLAARPRLARAEPAPPVAVVVPVPETPPTKACAYCGEPILPVAKKCKHCGELLDPAMRAAEERKAEGRGPRHQAQVVNVATTVIGSPLLLGPRRRRFRLLKLGTAMMIGGFVLAAFNQANAGAGVFIAGFLVGLLGLMTGLLGAIFG